MCNLYSIATNQAAIAALFRVVNRYVGNLAPMPGVFPDYPAPVVRNTGGERRWRKTHKTRLLCITGRSERLVNARQTLAISRQREGDVAGLIAVGSLSARLNHPAAALSSGHDRAASLRLHRTVPAVEGGASAVGPIVGS